MDFNLDNLNRFDINFLEDNSECLDSLRSRDYSESPSSSDSGQKDDNEPSHVLAIVDVLTEKILLHPFLIIRRQAQVFKYMNLNVV